MLTGGADVYGWQHRSSGNLHRPASFALRFMGAVLPLQDTLFGEERAGYLAALRQSNATAGGVGRQSAEPLDAEPAQDENASSKGEG